MINCIDYQIGIDVNPHCIAITAFTLGESDIPDGILDSWFFEWESSLTPKGKSKAAACGLYRRNRRTNKRKNLQDIPPLPLLVLVRARLAVWGGRPPGHPIITALSPVDLRGDRDAGG